MKCPLDFALIFIGLLMENESVPKKQVYFHKTINSTWPSKRANSPLSFHKKSKSLEATQNNDIKMSFSIDCMAAQQATLL